MQQSLEKKLSVAVVSGWWVILIAYAVLILQWIGYLWVMKTKPEYFLSLLGQDATWSQLQNIWLFGMVAYKIGVWFLIMLVLWMTLVERKLNKRG